MTRDEIKLLIKADIDELNPFTDTSLNPSIDIIEHILDNSARVIALFAPLQLLTPKEITGTPLIDLPERGVITIPLDSDFLKLHSIKLTDWKTEVTIPIGVTDPRYKYQKYFPLRGGVYKPVVVLKSTEKGKILECYSYLVEKTIDYKNYIPFTTAQALPVDLKEVIAWQCAADLIQILKGNPELAKAKVQEFFNVQVK